MTAGANDVWVFRIVHQDTGKPAPGVPVTVLDRAGNAEGHWVSDADGTVVIPRRETVKLRLRVGLRSEDPIELATATLGEGPTPPPVYRAGERGGRATARSASSRRPLAPPSSPKYPGTCSTFSGSSCSLSAPPRRVLRPRVGRGAAP